MRRNKILYMIWNVLSFIMGTAFNWVFLAVTVILMYVFMLRGYEYGADFAEKSVVEKEDIEISIEVEDTDTASDVYTKLEENGVIVNAVLFRFENMLKGTDTDYKSGVYTVKPTMTTSEINSVLRGESQDQQIKITILEGFTIEDIAEYLEANEVIDPDKFLWAVDNHDYSYDFLSDIPLRSRHRLMGYLFPDTYFVSADPTADEIINKMLSRFEDIYFGNGYDAMALNIAPVAKEETAEEIDGASDSTATESSNAESNATPGISMTMDEVITLASMIEKEYKNSEEREIGSAVIINRLKAGLNLRVPSTLTYALGKRRDRLTEADIDYDSPYNTYNKPNLPEGPICNPGAVAMLAALQPAAEDYLYSLLTDESSGAHVFVTTEEEYNAEKENYPQVYN
ncbi:MAG: endolytic transglycosylase MltG [Clostridiales bacterium]|jgi:UPF0755 protein|nr:endolytic transglycosylase MltG [Clostridiales bacterium]